MDEQIEIDLDLLQKAKTRKRVWVKPTATKKGYYREQEVGQKEIEKKPPRKDTGKIASLPEDIKKEILDLRRLGDSGAKIKESIENMFDTDPDLRDKFVESGILTLKAGSASLNVTGQSLVDWAKARGIESTKNRKTVKAVEAAAKEIEEKRFKETNEKLARLQTENKRLQEQLGREVKSKMESDSIRDKLRNENYILREKLKLIKVDKSVRIGKTIEINFDDLHKAQEEGMSTSRPGLVRKKVTVKRGGKIFQQYRWVKSGTEEPAEQEPAEEEPVKKPKKELVILGLNKPKAEPEKSDFASGLKKGMTINFKGEDKKIKFFNPDVKTVTFVGDDTNYPFEEVNKYGKEPKGEIEVGKPEPSPEPEEKPEPKVEEEPKTTSVHDAKKSMSSHIDNLNVKEGGEELLEGILEYTGGDFKRFNDYLRSGKIWHRTREGKVSRVKPTKKSKREIDEEMSKVSNFLKDAPKIECKTYRGMAWGDDKKEVKSFDTFMEQIKVGSDITFPTFSSTSSNEKVAMEFATRTTKPNAVVVEMQSKSGVYLDGVSAFEDEHEILFDRNSEFKVVKVNKDSDPIRIILEEV